MKLYDVGEIKKAIRPPERAAQHIAFERRGWFYDKEMDPHANVQVQLKSVRCVSQSA